MVCVVTRNVVGWVLTEKSIGVVTELHVRNEVDELQGLSRQDINDLKFQQVEDHAPATAQQEADQQADMWHKQWGVDLAIQELQWPVDLRDELLAIVVEELCEVAKTFPDDTGLGWDRWHHKVVCRFSPQLLQLLVMILMSCEGTGSWPRGLGVVPIALLEKSDGGFRPIGLLPTKARLWMRTRRILATKMGSEAQASVALCGQRHGANVAAWIQAAASERTAVVRPSVEYAQALLDLVKAFDRVPLQLLIREAIALGYPL